ncbi:AMP-binding protein [Nocardia higoensis]|uniref:AMP-binding protein n=1 Tax=Nocardia higoensis TaxID=228599 RepID=UPI0002DBE60A|nr:AMP-binding protein [Nocardia higoensis]
MSDLSARLCADEARGRAAVIMADSGAVLTFGELEDESNRIARLFADRGLRPGDHVAVLMTNELAYFPVVWAAQRSGLFYTPVNWHLTTEEAAYIVGDCGATVLVASAALAEAAAAIAESVPALHTCLIAGSRPSDEIPSGFEELATVTAYRSPEPRPEQTEGIYMFYSSGTTGRPKGIAVDLPQHPFGTGLPLDAMLSGLYGFGSDTVYLCPGPLYHAAPLGWSISTQRLGGTVVLMERFDAACALEAINLYRVTHAQFVPAMFVRMLKLPRATRESFDMSSLRVVVHAGAPCPIPVKEAMIEWWGPIIHEFYAGSEAVGFCAIDAPTWLRRKGSVGKAVIGVPHVLDEGGRALPPGEIGTLWFSGGTTFEYHNDPEKTAAAYDSAGRATFGDMGYLDEEGFVYLVDRRTDLIISGGVNIYPKEAEDVLTLHPAVADVAVIGIPDENMGHQVKAVVELLDPDAASPALADELVEYCRARIAHFKCPRTVDFVTELPRLPSGKLLKRVVRERYL